MRGGRHGGDDALHALLEASSAVEHGLAPFGVALRLLCFACCLGSAFAQLTGELLEVCGGGRGAAGGLVGLGGSRLHLAHHHGELDLALLGEAPEHEHDGHQCDDESGVDPRPQERLVLCGGVVEHRVGRDEGDTDVVHHDEADGDDERFHVLVQRDQRDHHEEAEVRLGHPAGEVDEHGAGEQQADARGHCLLLTRSEARRCDGEQRERCRFEQCVEEPVSLHHRDRDQDGHERPQNHLDHAMASIPRLVGHADALW